MHPSYAPRELTRTDHDSWSISLPDWLPEVQPGSFTSVTVNTTGLATDRYQVTFISDETGEESLPNVAGSSSGYSWTVSSVAVTSDVMRITTSATHSLLDNDEVRISGLATNLGTLNDKRFKVSVVSTTQVDLEELNGVTASAAAYGVTSVSLRS